MAMAKQFLREAGRVWWQVGAMRQARIFLIFTLGNQCSEISRASTNKASDQARATQPVCRDRYDRQCVLDLEFAVRCCSVGRDY
jgi:hypothetical protein